ncbi:MAG: LysR family transcriptional regulator [Roseovarius sp.]
MRLKLRHLEVFNALYDAGSVSRAAERLNLSQPAVSVALGNLEDTLGFRLFHRERGFFAPTSEAALLYDNVQQGVAALARLEQRADEVRTGASGRVAVATNGVLAMNFLPRVIAAFRREYPGAHIDVRVESSRQIATLVGNRQMDIGFIDMPVPVAGLKAEVHQLECVCICGHDDRLAQLSEVTPADLAHRQVIGITGDHVVDQQLRSAMVEAGHELEQPVTSCYFAVARNMVAAGDGVAVVDPINGQTDLGDGVVWRPFRPQIVHDLPVIIHKDRPLSITASRFNSFVKEALKPYEMTA